MERKCWRAKNDSKEKRKQCFRESKTTMKQKQNSHKDDYLVAVCCLNCLLLMLSNDSNEV